MKKVCFLPVFACLTTAQAIEDNGFLIEEAYNQEKGVIQFINPSFRGRDGIWGYSLTNEMPIKKQ